MEDRVSVSVLYAATLGGKLDNFAAKLFLQLTIMYCTVSLRRRSHEAGAKLCRHKMNTICNCPHDAGSIKGFFSYLRAMNYVYIHSGINKFTKKIRKPNAVDNNELADLLSRLPSDPEIVSIISYTVSVYYRKPLLLKLSF